MKTVLLKNNSGALLTVNISAGHGLHFLSGESKPVSPSVLEAPDVSRLMKRRYLAVIEEQPITTEKKKAKS